MSVQIVKGRNQIQSNKVVKVLIFSGYSHMMLRISEFRTGLTKVATYGHIPVPLVYTQVNVITDLILPNLNLNLKG